MIDVESTRARRCRAVTWSGIALLVILSAPVGARLATADDPPPAMGLDDAAHLLGRAGLGASPEQLREFARLDRRSAVARLLSPTRESGTRTAPPEWVDSSPADDIPRDEAMGLSRDEARRKRQQLQRERGRELKAWWYEELLSTDAPLRERMTVFWHNHFTSSLRKVKSPRLMYRQNVRLREHALGSFGALVRAMAKDPAMLQYLDGQRSRKNKPNENFARELLELFTLGEGHYTERDIKEAARAFTGWRIQRGTGDARYLRRQHDDGEKSFMGRTGPLDGDDIIRIVLENPQTARFVTEKLWKYLISPQPEPSEVAKLAATFRDSKYDTKTLVRDLLLSPSFWAAENRGALAKSPVDLLVGAVRTFDLPIWDIGNLAQLSRRLGQDLLDPPNVKGWPGGPHWISSSTLLLREQFLTAVATGNAEAVANRRRDRSAGPGRAFLEGWLERVALDHADPAESARVTLLRIAPLTATETDDDPAEFVSRLLRDPAYQVK